MRVEGLAWRRCAKSGHADKSTARPEPALPAELDRGLDGNPRRRAEDRIAVFLGGLLEKLPARHRDDSRADVIPGQRVTRGHRDGNLEAGGEQGARGRTFASAST